MQRSSTRVEPLTVGRIVLSSNQVGFRGAWKILRARALQGTRGLRFKLVASWRLRAAGLSESRSTASSRG